MAHIPLHFPMREADLEGLATRYKGPFYILDEKVLCKEASSIVSSSGASRSLDNAIEKSAGADGDGAGADGAGASANGASALPASSAGTSGAGSPEVLPALFFPLAHWPNPYIVKILAKTQNLGFFCQNQAELIVAQKAGISGERILFYSSHALEGEYCYANLMQTHLGYKNDEDRSLIKKALGILPEQMIALNLDTEDSLFTDRSLIEKASWYVYHEMYSERVTACQLTKMRDLSVRENPRFSPLLRAGELLYRIDGSIIEIRRPSEMNDHFAQLDFKGLVAFK